jgi:EmrB/QacA subfamily drug resistance transporter
MNTQPHPLRWWALLVLAFAQFITIMDTSIIGVALPDIQDELGFSAGDLSWVFNAYLLAFGGLLLLGGRLSDLLGAKRVFIAGLVVLLGGSLLAGLADSVGLELAGRAVQGVGAALAGPAALALVITLFSHDMGEMTKALGLFGAAAPAGGTAGVFLGGVLTDALDWRWTLLINVPLVLAVLAAAPSLLPAGVRRPERLDLTGAVLSSAALALLVFGIVQAPEVGWGSTQTVLVLAGAALLTAAFVAAQRVVRDPLVPLSVFRVRNLTAGNVALLLLGAAWVPMWFVANLYLRQVLDMSAFEAGAALLPMTLLIVFVMVGGIGRIIGRFGTRGPLVLGMVILAGGLALFSLVDANGSYVNDFLWASLVAALGMSLSYVPALQTGLSALPPEQGGLASGLLGTSYQVGSALGLAVLTVIGAGYGADELGDVERLTGGYQAEFIGAGVIALVGAIAAAVLIGPVEAADSGAAGADEEPSGEESRSEEVLAA